MQHNILVSITTLGLANSTWRDKLREIEELGIEEAALFLTGLDVKERAECFEALLKLKEKQAFALPFVHARTDMSADEFLFFVEHFGTERFNIHPLREYRLSHNLPHELRRMIFIENALHSGKLETRDLLGFAGICLDLSHLEAARRDCPKDYLDMCQLLSKHTIGVNHISAICEEEVFAGQKKRDFESHKADGPSDFMYLCNYPLEFFSSVCALELENPIAEQLQYKKVVAAIIDSISKTKTERFAA